MYTTSYRSEFLALTDYVKKPDCPLLEIDDESDVETDFRKICAQINQGKPEVVLSFVGGNSSLSDYIRSVILIHSFVEGAKPKCHPFFV